MPKPKIDITGKRFGRLVAIKEVEPSKRGRRYLCQCDCGNKKIIDFADLRSGHALSCGCLFSEKTSKRSLHDLTGKRFGRLTVIKRSNHNGEDGRTRAYWECRCDCGNMITVLASNLISGATKSCGCWKKESGYELRKTLESEYRKNGVMVPTLRRKRGKNNSTGVKGVSIVHTRYGIRYNAQLNLKNKRIWLGQYKRLQDATAARKAAEEKYFKPILDKDCEK